jgi:hypothetical protein
MANLTPSKKSGPETVSGRFDGQGEKTVPLVIFFGLLPEL